MANLTEQNSFDAGVYEIATTDPVRGGAGGISNLPGQNLANRTRWLYNQLQAVLAALANLAGKNSPVFTGSPQAPTAPAGDSSQTIANTAFVANSRSGISLVDVSKGGTITLTPAQYGCGIIALQGAMAADATIIVPASGMWIFEQYATGNFTCTIQGEGLATSVAIEPGSFGTGIFTDGTNTRPVQGREEGRVLLRVGVGGSITLNAPTGARVVNIKQIGGGAGGNHCQTQGSAGYGSLTYCSGPGGGAGAYAEWEAPVVDGQAVQIVVGGGGGSDANGSATISYVGAQWVNCGGGQTGVWNGPTSSAGGLGGSVTTSGNPNVLVSCGGGDGGDGMTNGFVFSGYGAPSVFGGGGRAGLGASPNGTTQANSAGLPAVSYGAGGGGAYSPSLESAKFYYGGEGYQGYALVEFRS